MLESKTNNAALTAAKKNGSGLLTASVNISNIETVAMIGGIGVAAFAVVKVIYKLVEHKVEVVEK